LLYRKKHTLQQAKLNRKERIDNLKNAFTVKKGMNCSGLKILLLDDVFTTGATLSSAAKTLKANNAGDIYVMVIGRR
jgi:predicted amidophosphoribosyltransferase